MKDVVVRFFNTHGGLDPFVEERFSPECEEEYFWFVLDKGHLTIKYSDGEKASTGKVYAPGRWAEVEYE